MERVEVFPHTEKNQVPSPDILPWLLKQNKQKPHQNYLNFKLCVVSVSKQIKVLSECAENANLFSWKNKNNINEPVD